MAVIHNQRCHTQLLESVLTQPGGSRATIQAHPQTSGIPSQSQLSMVNRTLVNMVAYI